MQSALGAEKHASVSGAECRVVVFFFNIDVSLQVFFIVEGTQAEQATSVQ